MVKVKTTQVFNICFRESSLPFKIRQGFIQPFGQITSTIDVAIPSEPEALISQIYKIANNIYHM
jgi:hypothetical protein